MIALLLALFAGTASAGTSAQPIQTIKGTQPGIAVPTQDLKDSGRSVVITSATAVAAAASETAISVSASRGFSSGAAAAVSQTVTAGKTLRIQALSTAWTKGVTGGQSGNVHLRAQSSGTCAATSPLVWTVHMTTIPVVSSIPDGLELSGAQTFCLSHIETGTAGSPTLEITLVGFEY